MMPALLVHFLVILIGWPGAIKAVDNFFSLTYLGFTCPQAALQAVLLGVPTGSS